MPKAEKQRKSTPREGDSITAQVAGQALIGLPVVFSTGSHGWIVSGKVLVDGKAVQFTGNAVLIHSKPQG